jgi:D-alanine--poly(phosphoribitol) ligase subunit 1
MNNSFQNLIITRLLDVFESLADRNAFCIENRFFTYNDLASNVSRIRNAIRERKFNGNNIGLVVNDDIETYAAIISIWFEGYSYVPLHPNQPEVRIREIILQSEVELIIDSHGKIIHNPAIILTSKNFSDYQASSNTCIRSEETLAYLLYTSGSTGQPKGVQITRGNLAAFISAFSKSGLNIDQNDRCLQCFDLTFDVSVQSFLIPLLAGACVYTVPHHQIKFEYVYYLLNEHDLTFGAMTPSLIRYLQPYFREIYLPNFRCCILTAEGSPIDLITEWSKCIPNAMIYNFYGPTEGTIYCSCQKFNVIENQKNKHHNGILSIGKPMDKTNLIIVDEDMAEVQRNKIGQLCINGEQVSPGYWKNNEKNHTSFFNYSYKGTIKRFYKTGDTCYIDEEGDIVFIGRMDYQVKINGYRVELGEIEFHARKFLKFHNAIALTYKNKFNINELILFIEEPEPIDNEKEIRKYLSNILPYYMIPSLIIKTKSFPLNSSGKIDRLILLKSLIENEQ